ncbi:unnamed protein product [Heterosigma akashiwo]
MYLDPSTGTEYLWGEFERITLPYVPYVSNCFGYDSYVPISELLENENCGIPVMNEKITVPDERFDYPAQPHKDNVRYVGPYNVGSSPIADVCDLSITCNYEEDLANPPDVASRWFEHTSGTSLWKLIRQPADLAQFTGRAGNRVGPDDTGSAYFYDLLESTNGTDSFISVVVDRSAANSYTGGTCTKLCYPRSVQLQIGYYQLNHMEKRIIFSYIKYADFDEDDTVTEYTFSVEYFALNWWRLIVYFAFEWQVFVLLFVVIGGISVVAAAALYAVVYLTTRLENPPKLRVHSMFALLAPPPTVGCLLGLLPNCLVIALFWVLINAYQWNEENDYDAELPSLVHFMDDDITYSELEDTRKGRTGLCFVALSAICLFAGARIFLPQRVSKREKELEKKRDERANKESVWIPTTWKRSNLVFSSYLMGLYCLIVCEFSFWSYFGTYFWHILVLSQVFGQFSGTVIDNQLKEVLLAAPIGTAQGIIDGVVTLAASDFLDFLLGYFIDKDTFYNSTALHKNQSVIDHSHESNSGATKLNNNNDKTNWMFVLQEEEEQNKKRDLEGIVEEGAETVEPILDCFGGYSTGTMTLFYTPFIIAVLYVFASETQMPTLSSKEVMTDMMYYLYFALIIIFFQLCADVFILGTLELYHGWKIYDYLVYTRYRFLQP